MPQEPPNQKVPPPRSRGLMPIVLVVLVLLVFLIFLARMRQSEEWAWSELLEKIKEGQVNKIVLHQDYAEVEPAKGEESEKVRVKYPGAELTDSAREQINYHRELAKEAEHEPPPVVGGDPPSFWSSLIPQLVIFGLLILLLWFFLFRRMGQGGGVLSFGKSRATLVAKGKTGRTFKDVAGIDEAREEVEELVDFLRQPKKFQKLGGRIPRGVLLVGPPGTGKTLLAKAIAGEADVPFYSISGSDFVEMFVGVGASRVRDLFQQAKENSPCIIFMDEIDAVARRRGSGMSSGGHDEREQTLNAILVEMDGFNSADKVIVIAATNRVDVLDPALTRPGRFDRHIFVNLPDLAGREQILQVHASKVRLAADANLNIVARSTPGFSGADLENLINEAALHAARFDKDAVYLEDLEYARDRIAFGREKKAGSAAIPEDERRVTAYHEAGHAIIMARLDDCEDLHKVSIIPRGRALGSTMFLPKKDRYTHSRKKLLGDICQLFGGRIAEAVFFDEITTGAANDIDRASHIARGMVYEWGMSEKMGPIKYTETEDSVLGSQTRMVVSEQTCRELDEEVRRVIDSQYERAKQIVEDNKDAVERIAEALLERETLSAEQVYVLIEGGQLEPRKPIPPLPSTADRPAEEENKGDEPAGGSLEPAPA